MGCAIAALRVTSYMPVGATNQRDSRAHIFVHSLLLMERQVGAANVNPGTHHFQDHVCLVKTPTVRYASILVIYVLYAPMATMGIAVLSVQRPVHHATIIFSAISVQMDTLRLLTMKPLILLIV